MDKIEHLLRTSVEQLVREIVAVNHAWKAARELFGDDSALSTSTRDLKTCLQVRLLREHAPDQVYLVKDSVESNQVGEEIYRYFSVKINYLLSKFVVLVVIHMIMLIFGNTIVVNG